ncbi:hypothetical protein Micbo1qcDRAFT_159930 [Microdochium bolleyi]|uniref:Aminoglycoside phosphotransferase domain-containing protein n=1 Tax=Microdochium bolleyi TaxID=196109 RepID=A0A136JC70_9PEZI|nr:hypothetical protein Micbo1qcDRAFT_159930 [Microdochium bolleyi]
MSFVPGRLVSRIWFDEHLVGREQVRLRILTNLASIMAQLSALSFDKMGSVLPTHSAQLGPIFDWVEPADEGEPMQVAVSGPFDTLRTFLDDAAAKQGPHKRNDWSDGREKILAVLRECFLAADAKSGGRFVLRPPDFDSQNVLADEEGNITGLIDWDLAHTFPRILGYAAYPGWITRDWDPLMYGWPKMADSENSPAELQRYRLHYSTELGKVSHSKADLELNKTSHLIEAIWIGLLNYHNQLPIVMKFVRAVLGEDANAIRIMIDIGKGEFGESQWKELSDGLRAMILGPA